VLPVYADGRRGIYFCQGSNLQLDGERLFGQELRRLNLVDSFQVFHFGYPSLLPKLQGSNLGSLFEAVRGRNIFISLDTTSLLDEKKHREMIDPALPYVGMLHANLEEAASLTGQIGPLLERLRAAAINGSKVRP
jgi:sugar/nucleoside kinase (ribokinase family)